jgi:Ca2+-binding RTX toxin-like protein
MTIVFSPATELLLSSQPNVLLTSDLNGDGNLDLITNFSDPFDVALGSRKTGVSVLYGTGSGQFAAEQKYAIEQISPNPQYAAYQQQYAAYQQRYQTAYQNYQSFVNSLPSGVTPPPFSYPETPPSPPSQTQATPISVRAISVGDVDRDGKLDLITIGSYYSLEGGIARQKPVISVLKGTGSGFSAAINSPVAAISDYPGGLAVADFNDDGNLDVAAISADNVAIDSTSKQRVSILFGDGTGRFSNEKEIFLGINTSTVVAADFNRDGLPDLAIGGQGKTVIDVDDIGATVSVLLSTGAGNFSAPNTISIKASSGGFPFSLFTADFNSDGKIDLGNGNWYLAGDGTGQFAKPYEFELSNDQIATGDFNSDGKLDVIGYISTSNSISSVEGISALFGNGVGRYSYPGLAFSGGLPSATVAGDFDRDGKPDLALLNFGSTGTITVFLNRTTSSDSLVMSGGTIDASMMLGGLSLNLKTGTLQINGINKPLTEIYQSVRGTEQADQITGGKRGEYIDGLAGNDVIVGGDGNDSLIGGLGNDTLTGGKDKDEFIFNNGETFIGIQSIPFSRAMGVDKITDFESGKDKIKLYRDTFTAFTNRRFSFESVGTKKAAQKSKALITYIPKTGSLFYNQNGAKAGFGAGGLFADLTNGLDIRAQDFLLS